MYSVGDGKLGAVSYRIRGHIVVCMEYFLYSFPFFIFFFFNDTATPEFYPLSLHAALPIFIPTGSAPRLTPGLTLGHQVMTSDELLANTVVPKRLIVLGAGAVGVEFASAYRRFGSEVTVVEMLPRLLPIEDDDISTEFEKAFRKRGIKSLTNAKLEKVDVGANGLKATVTTSKGTEILEADLLLCAVGRRPVSENVGLEKFAAIKMERGFVLVDPSTLLTGESWVSAIDRKSTRLNSSHSQISYAVF